MPIRKAPLYVARGAILLGTSRGSFCQNALWRGQFWVSRSRFPFAKTSQIHEAVVVYPETVVGNPLAAPRYVRWFLHEPTFHTGVERDFEGELYFYFIEAFQEHLPKAVCGGRLTLIEYFRDIYKLENTEARHKVCYLLRKGRESQRSSLSRRLLGWFNGYEHKDMAKAFNECAICFIYDPYTLYATYAALCGCVPVIVPLAGVTKEQWLPEEHLRYGLAYGEDDIPYALATRGLLIARLDRDDEANFETVKMFVERIQEFFFHTAV